MARTKVARFRGRSLLVALAASLVLAGGLASTAPAQEPAFRALVFTETAAFRHGPAIEAGVAMFQRLATQHNFEVVHTEDSSVFNDESLATFDVVVMLQASGDPWTAAEKAALERYARAGGGIVAIHNSADMRGNYEWWDNLIGALMPQHSANGEVATVKVADRKHPSTRGLPSRYERPEEWYNFDRNLRGGAHVLLTVDETTYDPGPAAMGPDHPISWCKNYQGARAWVTAMGHNPESYTEDFFVDHVLGGVQWAAGVAPGDCGGTVWSNYEKVTLDDNTSAPFELEVAPDGRVFYTEIALGELRVWDPDTGQTTVAGELDVYSGGEDGLLGVALDPDFEQNQWIYLYYSPASDNDADPANWINRLSRFRLEGNQLDLASERVVIEVPASREDADPRESEPGHTGGGLEFGPDGNLYLSVGDDTRPFESSGRAPIDERPGRETWDAQRTSANTNDLRGKILRITPQDDEDGGYTIPAGNMFAPGTMSTRPEIYAMGFRNPFRFKIDPVTGWISLADYGPDAAADDPNRGPRGFVEWMLVKGPGFYGWPYCVANGLAYRDYDFATGVSGPAFNCAAPVNDSPNNTGLRELPPMVPADIWYPYDQIDEFPEMGAGGAAPMGGPFYRFDPELQSDTKFPEYFDGTPFFMEWSRNFIKELRLDDEGELLKINDFLPADAFDDFLAPMDMEFGPDGAMYMLDWGGGFGRDNPLSSLYRIDYTQGDRRPVARATATPDSGQAPLEVRFSSEGSRDPEGATITYAWDFGDGTTSTEANPTHTYTANGEYNAQLTVTDPGGKTGRVNVTVTVGNTRPDVAIDAPPNGGFFEFGDNIPWRVSVTDAEDGSTGGGGIDCADLTVQHGLGHDEHPHYGAPIRACEGTTQTTSEGHDVGANLYHLINAEYTDSGGTGVDPLVGRETVVLQPKHKQAEHHSEATAVDEAASGDIEGGGDALANLGGGNWAAYEPVSFTGIDSIAFRVASSNPGGRIELRAGAPDGELLGAADVPDTGGPQEWTDVILDAPATTETLKLYLVFTGNAGFRLNFFEAIGKGVSPVTRPEVRITSPTEGEAVDPGDVTLAAEATDAENAITKVEFFVDGESVGEDTSAPYSVTWNQTEEDFYTVRAVATNDRGLTRESRAVQFTVGDIAVKPPWTTFANVAAGFTQLGDTFTIDAAGADTWQATDQYGSIYQPDAVGENFVATVRVDSYAHVHGRGKAGIIVRNDMTQPGQSPGYVALAVTGTDGIEMLRDTDGNGQLDASTFGGATQPYPTYLRLEKYGTRFIGSFSKNGTTWTQVADVQVPSAAATQDLGLFEVSHVAGTQAPARFSAWSLDTDPDPPDPDPGFDPPPPCVGVRSDEFDGNALDRGRWTVLRGAEGDMPSVSGGALVMPVTNGDINEGSAGPVSYAGQPLPSGAWQATTKVTIAHDNEWQHAALVQHVDDNNYVKFAFTRNSGGGRFLEFQSETNGTRTWHGSNVNLPADFPTTIHLRLESDGSQLRASYSTDGSNWTALGGVAPQKAGGTIGPWAAGDTDAANVDASFDWFRVTPDEEPEDPGFDDQFDGDGLDGCRWDRITHYRDSRLNVAGGKLSIQTFDADINGASNGPIENLILQTPPEGDWTVETKMTAPLADNWQLAGLLLYADDDHYVKYDVVADNNPGAARDLRVELRKEEGGPLTGPGQADIDPPASESNTWWLRLTKEGNTYSGAISADGETWVESPGTVTANLEDPAIGLMAIGPSQAAPITVDFDHFRLVPDEPVDEEPPTTTATLDPAQPDGDGGWYVSPVRVALAADDGEGSGVERTEYRVDGGSWQAYGEPFTVGADGEHTVEYRSVDRAGNEEQVRSTAFKIDRTAPSATCAATPNELWPPNNKLRPVTVGVNVTDPTSGPGGFTLTETASSDRGGSDDIVDWRVGTADTQGSLRAERSGRDGRTYSLRYRARDAAGNTADCTATVRVPRSRGGGDDDDDDRDDG